MDDEGEALGREGERWKDGPQGGADDENRGVVIEEDEAAEGVGSVEGATGGGEVAGEEACEADAATGTLDDADRPAEEEREQEHARVLTVGERADEIGVEYLQQRNEWFASGQNGSACPHTQHECDDHIL